MCKLKSAIVLKDRIYMPDHDHHTQMLEELGIEDSSKSHEFVRVELLPPHGDMFSDVETWQLNIDQDFIPDWFFEELELPKIRECAKKWSKQHVFIGIDGLELPRGNIYYLKNCKKATLWENSTATLRENSTVTLRENSTATLWGNSTATLLGNSTATLWGNSTATLSGNSTATLSGNSTATLWGNSTATLWGNSTATLRENSTATLWGNSTATLRENSTATLRENSTATLRENSTATLRENSTGLLESSCYRGKRENYLLMDNSTLKDCAAKTIYQSGDWAFSVVKPEEA